MKDVPDGLALMGHAELIDWPLRTTRFVRDLVLTARAATELAKHVRSTKETARNRDEASSDEQTKRLDEIARRCIECSVAVSKNNAGGLAMPMTDDQLIELTIIWRTWLDHGGQQSVRELAGETLTRLALRRRASLPGPALHQRARTPMRELDARILAEAWVDRPPPEFEDEASTLLPVVLVVASMLGEPVDPNVLLTFGAVAIGERKLPPISLQSWIPPDDAPLRWYGAPLLRTGTCHIHTLTDPDALLEQFLESQPQLPPSPASAMGFECIDAMAWVLWRTRPPLRWLLDELPSPAPRQPDEG